MSAAEVKEGRMLARKHREQGQAHMQKAVSASSSASAWESAEKGIESFTEAIRVCPRHWYVACFLAPHLTLILPYYSRVKHMYAFGFSSAGGQKDRCVYFCDLGHALMTAGRHAAAMSAFTSSLAIDPEHAKSAYLVRPLTFMSIVIVQSMRS